MTDHPIKDVVGVVDGDRLKWRSTISLSIFIRDRRSIMVLFGLSGLTMIPFSWWEIPSHPRAWMITA